MGEGLLVIYFLLEIWRLGIVLVTGKERVGMVREYKDYFVLGHDWMIEKLYSRRKEKSLHRC